MGNVANVVVVVYSRERQEILHSSRAMRYNLWLDVIFHNRIPIVHSTCLLSGESQ